MLRNNNVVVGSRFGSVVVVERTAAKKNAVVRCDCGNRFATYTYTLARGETKMCRGCLNASRRGVPNLKNRIGPMERTINEQWNVFRKNMRTKPGSTLSKEEWLLLATSNCFYCDRPPSNVRKRSVEYAEDFIYSGVDRIDSSLGYTSNNVRPCCWTCNRMKGNMTEEEFYSHVRRIYAYQSV